MKFGRTIFGFRDDIDLNQRWWHRLAKVAFILTLAVWALWFALALPADLPSGPGNIRITETLEEYVKEHPDDGDPVASFSSQYGYRSGKRGSDGDVEFAFFETELYCAVNPYKHLDALRRYMRPVSGKRPTSEDALAVLQSLDIKTDNPDSYTCILPNGAADIPGPTEIVGWEHTLRAQVIGNAQKYGILLLVLGVVSFVVLNLYYRGIVYVVCGPRKRAASGASSL